MLARSEIQSARPWPEGSAVMMMMSVASHDEILIML